MADVYVKLDDVINIIKEINWNLGGLIQHLKEHCPTADVVPKSEVDRWREEAENQSILWRNHFESIYETGNLCLAKERS